MHSATYEDDRVRAVRAVQLGSSGNVAGLSSLVQAAAIACKTEMAAISLVGESDIVVIHSYGLAATTFPRVRSFCSIAMASTDVVEVRDAPNDPAWASVELVVNPPHIRFYAAAPLVDHDGMQLGTLCVLDRAPLSLTPTQRDQLRLLGDGVLEILEARRHRTERSAQPANHSALRTLASGVGHEINNPLSFVATNLDFAVDELRAIAIANPLLAAALEEIVVSIAEAKDGAQRIRKIVRGLQSFADQEIPKRPTNVASSLESAAAMAMHQLRPRATLEMLIDELPPVLADDGGLTHVVVNLLVNAAQSFPDANPSANKVTLRAVLASDEAQAVAISVTDNGPGIAPHVLPRIFDPFFTTKPVGHGSGLGLSLSHTIVSSLGGKLLCETALGTGTTFTVVLPIADVRQSPSELPKSGTKAIARGRILLIDDEESLLRAMTRLLKPDHEIVTVSDARTALTMLTEEPGAKDFDLVFCDLMMPRLTGMELYAKVKAHDPAIAARFVFMTAGAISDDARSFLATSENPNVEKPFTSHVLRALAQKLVRKFSVRPQANDKSGMD